MSSTLFPLLLMATFAAGQAHSEALMVSKNEVQAATIVKKQSDETKKLTVKNRESSAPEERKDEVKGES